MLLKFYGQYSDEVGMKTVRQGPMISGAFKSGFNFIFSTIFLFLVGCTGRVTVNTQSWIKEGHVYDTIGPNLFPTTPTLSRSIATASRIDLSWTVSTGAAPITYTVKRSTASDGGFVDVTGCVGLSNTSCNDSSVVAGTRYYYIVNAIGPGGVTSSNQVSGTPMAPFSVSLIPGNGQIEVRYESPGAVHYTLQYGTTSGVYSTTIPNSTSPTVVSGLDYGSMYFFMVTAKNEDGAIAALSEASGSPSGAWLSDYLYRQKIMINNAGVSQSTPDAPIFVELPSTFDYTATHPDKSGKDIRFTSSDGKTLLPFHFEDWVYGSKSKMWVRTSSVPASGNAAELFIYYGKSNATDGQNESAVWSQSTGLRLRMDDSAELPKVLDSVSGIFGTALGGVTSISGLFHKALSFDGLATNATTKPVNTEILTGVGSSTKKASIGIWIKPEMGTAHGFRRIIHSDAGYFGLSNTEVINLAFYDSRYALVADLRGRTATDRRSDGGSSGPWQFIAASWEQTDLDTTLDGGATTFESRSYFNGSRDAAWMSEVTPDIATSTKSWRVGNREDGSRPYKGALDNLLIRESADSDDYFGLHYASVRGSEARVGVAQLANLANYSLSINGTNFTFTSDSSATVAEIVSGLALLINAGTEPVSAGRTGNYLWINPRSSSETFSLGISDRLSRVVRSDFNKDVRVSIGSVLNSTSYQIVINGASFRYLSDADATEGEILAGLLASINAGSFPVSASISGSNLEFSLKAPTVVSLTASGNLSATADGADQILSVRSLQNSTLYRVTVGGMNADYMSDATATSLEIRNGLIQSINTLSDLNATTASIESSQVRVRPATPREYSISTSSNLNLSASITPFLKFGLAESR